MKFGVILLTDRDEGPEDAWAAVEMFTATVEELGFDSLFVGHPPFWRRFHPLPVLGRLAGITRRVTLGSNIITLPLYAPGDVAESFATLDAMTGGRIVLGIALGWRPEEFAAAGVPFASRLSRYREAVEIIRRLWTEPSVTFKGKHFQLDNAAVHPKPVQQPHPPIWVGAHHPDAVRRAAQMGLIWCDGPRAKFSSMENKVRIYRESLTSTGGIKPELPLIRDAFCLQDGERVRRATVPYLVSTYKRYAEAIGLRVTSDKFSFEELTRDRCIIGSPEECIREVQRYRRLGVDHLIFRIEHRGMPRKLVLEMLETLATRVVPYVRG